MEIMLSDVCGEVWGVVVTEDGAPQREVPVAVVARVPHVPADIKTETVTDARGRFSFADVCGDVVLTADAPNLLLPAEVRTTIRPGQKERVELVLRPVAVVEGGVTLDGVPLEGLQVLQLTRGKSETDTDAEGMYRLFIKPSPGLFIGCRYQGLLQRKGIIVESGMSTEVDFAFTGATSTISGAVLLDNEPLPQSMFELTAVQILGDATATLDVKEWDGGYEVSGLQKGRFTICATVKPSADSDAALRAGAIVDVLSNQKLRQDLYLTTATGKLSGRVTGVYSDDEAGVILLPSNFAAGDLKMFPWFDVVETILPASAIALGELEEDGSFRFEGIPPGRYKLVACARSQAVVVRDLDDDMESVRISGSEVVVEPGLETILGLELAPVSR